MPECRQPQADPADVSRDILFLHSIVDKDLAMFLLVTFNLLRAILSLWIPGVHNPTGKASSSGSVALSRLGATLDQTARDQVTARTYALGLSEAHRNARKRQRRGVGGRQVRAPGRLRDGTNFLKKSIDTGSLNMIDCKVLSFVKTKKGHPTHVGPKGQIFDLCANRTYTVCPKYHLILRKIAMFRDLYLYV